MSLNKTVLEESIKQVLLNEQNEKTDANASVERIATGLANAFDAFVKSGDVNVNVQTTGTAAAQTGTGTGKVT
jgi:FlaG/FlaF family flagellin (archaellin)